MSYCFRCNCMHSSRQKKKLSVQIAEIQINVQCFQTHGRHKRNSRHSLFLFFCHECSWLQPISRNMSKMWFWFTMIRMLVAPELKPMVQHTSKSQLNEKWKIRTPYALFLERLEKLGIGRVFHSLVLILHHYQSLTLEEQNAGPDLHHSHHIISITCFEIESTHLYT